MYLIADSSIRLPTFNVGHLNHTSEITLNQSGALEFAVIDNDLSLRYFVCNVDGLCSSIIIYVSMSRTELDPCASFQGDG